MGQPTIRYVPHSADINTAGSVSAWINQIKNIRVNNGVELFEETTSAEVDTQFVAQKLIAPVINFDTSDLTILTTVGINGVPITSGSGAPGLTFWARAVLNAGLPDVITNSTAISAIVSDGILVPKTLQCANNEVAQLNLECHAVLGSTDTYSGVMPIVYATGQQITSGSTVTTNVYTGGPVKFTVGSTSSFAQGVSTAGVDFGIKVDKDSIDSNFAPTSTHIFSRAPKIQWTTKDPSIIATIGMGVEVVAFAAYFYGVASGGTRATTGLKIAGTAGMITPGELTLAHQRPGEASFIYTPNVDSTPNAIITITTGATVPTS